MPREVEQALRRQDFLYVKQRSTGRRYSISIRLDPGMWCPFHLNCTLPVSAVTMRGRGTMRRMRRGLSTTPSEMLRRLLMCS